MAANDREIKLTQNLMAHYERNGVSRRQFLKMLGVVGGGSALGGLLAACGAAPAASPTAGASTEAPAEATAAPAAGSASTGVIVYASGQDISNLDPHTGHDYSIATTQKSVYDTLFRYKNNPPEVEQLLAAEYSANEDATVWTFTLPENAVFHTGAPVLASDVVYSAGRMLRKNKGASWLFTSILTEDSVVAEGERTVVFNLTNPFAPLPLVLPWLFIVSEAQAKEHEVDGDEGEGWLLEHEAGSGPFTIKSWSVGDSYEFTAVEDYWAGWDEAGHAPGYIWKVARESSSARLGMLNGDFHMAFDLSTEDADALAADPNFIVGDQPGLSIFSVKLNNAQGPTSDVHIRKMLAYAMDYESVIAALNGKADLINGPLPNLGDFNDPALVPYRFDLEKAKEELALSEYAEGLTLEYVYVTGFLIEEQVGLILLDKLSQIGVTLTMTPLVWPDMVARAADPETAPNLIAIYSGTTYADPDNYLWASYHSSQAGSWSAASHYNNPEIDTLLLEARSTADHERRVELYHQIQQTLVEDAVEVWMYAEYSRVAWTTKLQGYDSCPIMGFYIRPMYLTA